MSNWKKVKLSEIISQCSNTEYISDVQNEHYITLSLYGKGAHERIIKDGKYPVPFLGYRVRTGQFIYSRIDARNGAYDIIGQELDGFVVSKDFPIYDIDTEQVLPHFLLRSVLSTGFINQVKHSSFGATNRMRIKEDVFASYSIMLPPKDQQQTIVDILDRVSAIIEDRQKQLSALDDLIKARFVEMFGDPILNQKGFPVYRMDEVVEFQGGSQPDKKYFEYRPTPDNIRLIQIRDYKTDNYMTYIPKSMAKRFCTADDIMIGRYGPPIFQILQGIEGSFNVALMKAVPKMGNREFVRYFLKQDCLLQYLEGMSKRTAGQDGIQMDKLKAYPFPMPPIEFQEQFATFVAQIDKSKSAIQKSLDETQILFDCLMQKYFG